MATWQLVDMRKLSSVTTAVGFEVFAEQVGCDAIAYDDARSEMSQMSLYGIFFRRVALYKLALGCFRFTVSIEVSRS